MLLSRRGAPRRRSAWILAVFLFLAAGSGLRAQQSVVFSPANTSIEFTLGATLHTVHGTFRLKHGAIQFDPATGDASGEIVVDATSAETGNSSRDRNMHADVLESPTYPEIIFSPTRIAPAVATPDGKAWFPLSMGTTKLNVSGKFRLHGQDHDLTIPVAIERQGGELHATARFPVPYVKWGLKNPSTFVLRVGDTVNVEVHSSISLP